MFITGSDGLEYEFINWRKLLVERPEDPAIKKVFSWIDPQIVSDSELVEYNRKIYFNSDLVDRIEREIPKEYDLFATKSKWEVLKTFRPPVLDLTVDDFFDLIHNRYKKAVKEITRSPRYGSWLMPNFAAADSSSSYELTWREDTIAERSNTDGYIERVGISKILQKTWRPSVKEKPNYAREIIKLNHYLYGEGAEFNGTFQEFMDNEKNYSESMQRNLTQYLFEQLDDKNFYNFIEFASSKNVATFNNVTKKKRDVLLNQNQDTWKLIIKDAIFYQKGKDFDSMMRFLQELEIKMGTSSVTKPKIFSDSELRKKYVVLLSQAVLSTSEKYDPELTYRLSAAALEMITGVRGVFAAEHTKLIKIVEKIEKQSGVGMTLKQVLGLLAAPESRIWIRSTGDKGIFLLCDLLERSEQFDILNLLYEIVYTDVLNSPTETEWYKASKDMDFAIPAEMFLTLACSPNALNKARNVSYSSSVERVRNFNINGK